MQPIHVQGKKQDNYTLTKVQIESLSRWLNDICLSQPADRLEYKEMQAILFAIWSGQLVENIVQPSEEHAGIVKMDDVSKIVQRFKTSLDTTYKQIVQDNNKLLEKEQKQLQRTK